MVISLTSPTLEDRVDDGERTVAYCERLCKYYMVTKELLRFDTHHDQREKSKSHYLLVNQLRCYYLFYQ